MNLLTRLSGGETSVGPFLKLSDPAVVEIMGLAGFDHVVIDLEHGPHSIESAQNLVRAAELRGLAPLVRVAANEPSQILRALDIGAQGVHVPHISSAADAQKAVSACRFFPRGERGLCRYVRAAEYTHLPAEEHLAESNRRVVPILHIEGVKGIENLDSILPLAGIGALFIGPYDLSQSCGVPAEVHHPLVIEKMREAVAKAREAGVFLGTFVESVDDVRLWSELGVQYLCYSVDVGLLYRACREITDALKSG